MYTHIQPPDRRQPSHRRSPRGLALALVFGACGGPWLGGGALTPEAQAGSHDLGPGPYARRYGHLRPRQVLHGRASYYHDALSGNTTANGEIYRPRHYSAAHRSLPFGTIVRVRRRDNGQAVIVRINDRGPFGRRKRIIDLSRAAANALDMIREGVVDVRVEVLGQGASAD